MSTPAIGPFALHRERHIAILTSPMIYLDWAAAAPPDTEILNECTELSRWCYANPSSPHLAGRQARDLVEDSRTRCATVLGVPPSTIFFTASATESNNIVLSSLLLRDTAGEILTTGFEHESVHQPIRLLERRGFRVRRLSSDRSGRLDPSRLYTIESTDVAMAAIVHVNNVTGAIQPLKELSAEIRRAAPTGRSVHIHADLAQSLGRIPLSLDDLDIDSAAASGYKLGAPRGAGLLYLRRNIETVYRGGSQESGLRPGTEHVVAIAGLARALERSSARLSAHNKALHPGLDLKRSFVKAIREHRSISIIHDSDLRDSGVLDSAVLDPTAYSPYICSVTAPPHPGEVLVRIMSDSGYQVSTGAACSSRHSGDHRVYLAMGHTEEESASSVRISWGSSVTTEDLEGCAQVLAQAVARLSRVSRR